MTIRCPNPDCGQPLLLAEEDMGKELRCPACQQAFRVPEAPEAVQGPEGPPPEPPPAAAPPERCPACGHKVARAGKRCVYCGASLTAPPEEQATAGTDLVAGVSMRLLDANGAEVLDGKMAARDDGLHITGYPQSGTPGAGAALGDLAGRAALSVALSAITPGFFFVPRFSNLGEGDGPAMLECTLPWDAIEEVEHLADRIRLTVVTEQRKWGKTQTKLETFDLVLTCAAGEPDRAAAVVVEQLIRFGRDPSVMAHCPGCDRVVTPGTTRCAYCGATWA